MSRGAGHRPGWATGGRATVAALLVGVAASAGAAPPAPAAAAAPAAVRNVVLVSIDSLRADHLSFYGYPRETMPRLRSLVERRGGTIYRRLTAVSPSCHPSHSSMLTGLYPHQLGIPWCGEDLLVNEADFESGLAELEEYQDALRDSPPALVRKKLTSVMNWLVIPARTPILASFLHDRGFHTGGFTSIWTVKRRFGYARGFERFVDAMPEYYGPRSLTWLLRDTLKSQRRQVGEATVDAALAYLAALPPAGRFFLFVHLADTHVPYAPRDVGRIAETVEARQRVEQVWRRRYPEELYGRALERMTGADGELLLDRYDRSILYVDRQLDRLFAALAAAGRLDDTLVIVTSDHGDAFGQRTYLSEAHDNRLFFEHSLYVWEETEHVPLLVLDPVTRGGVRFAGANVSHVDLVPTILDRLGFAVEDFAPAGLPGEALDRLEDAPRTVFYLTFGRGRPGLLRHLKLDYPKFIGLRHGDVKFFVDRDRFRDAARGRCFYFDLATDPDELHNGCEELDAAERNRYRQLLVEWYSRSAAARAAPLPPPPGPPP